VSSGEGSMGPVLVRSTSRLAKSVLQLFFHSVATLLFQGVLPTTTSMATHDPNPAGFR
jgi:hypothetical protein